MIFTLERVTQPALEPVTLAEMKRHLRVDSDITAEDDDISGLIVVAREWVEDYTGRALIDQTWRLTVGDYVPTDTTGMIVGQLPPSSQGILLRRSPVIAITSVATVDSANAETAVSIADYQLRDANSKWPRILGLDAATETRVTFRSGFANTAASPAEGAERVPNVIKHAIKLIVANYYDQREPVNIGNIGNTLPLSIPWLLNGERCNLQFA